MRDEDDLFEGVDMTKEELRKRNIQKQILTMAKDKYRFNYKDDGYQMPEGYVDSSGKIDRAKREGVLTARYEEDEQVKTEQEQWEEDRVKMSVHHYGNKDKNKPKEEQYELLVEDQIEFISHELLKGKSIYSFLSNYLTSFMSPYVSRTLCVTLSNYLFINHMHLFLSH